MRPFYSDETRIGKIEILAALKPQKIIENQENAWKIDKKSQIVGSEPQYNIKFGQSFWLMI